MPARYPSNSVQGVVGYMGAGVLWRKTQLDIDILIEDLGLDRIT